MTESERYCPRCGTHWLVTGDPVTNRPSVCYSCRAVEQAAQRMIRAMAELTPKVRQGEWVNNALCAEVGGDLWFPEVGNNAHEAKAICRQCPVMNECAEWAIRTRERNGVWGGMTERERRRLYGEAAA